MADKSWIAEAVVDFLRGPLYINPLMAFIDDKCMIFTPEDENKLEYTPVHTEFKELVDNLLTDFVQELGVSSEEFFEIMAAEQDKDKLSGFVIQTILTVDDFLLFKAMMVKRNIDLTNQVLAAVEAMVHAAGGADMEVPARQSGLSPEEEAKMIEEALQLSEVLHQNEEQAQRLRQLMWALQMEEEDIALAIAIANSLKDQARMEGELAELNQAVAMSSALSAQHGQMVKEGSFTSGASSSAAGGPSGAAGARPTFTPTPVQLEALAPLNIGANSAAEQMSAVAAAAEASARMAAAAAVSSTATLGGKAPDVVATARKGVEGLSLGAKFAPAELNLPAGVPGQAASKQAGAGRFVPAALNLDGPRKPSEDVPSENLVMAAVCMERQTSNKNVRMAAGYRNDANLNNIRDAAAAAAQTQKALLSGNKGKDESAQKWLQDQKLKLVAQKKAEREAETAAYKAGQGVLPRAADVPGSEDLESKRAALRNKLAQKFKEDLVKSAM